MGGGGGDQGYEQRQQQTEAKKQEARNRLNVLFGADGGAVRARPVDRTGFYRVDPEKAGQTGEDALSGFSSSGMETGNPLVGSGMQFDDAGYADAVARAEAEAAALNAQGGGNRAARDNLYQTVRDNAFNSGKRRLEEDKGEAARKLKFELFARGQNGGSEDINQNALLGRTYNEGVMDLGAKADAARAQFRGDDETTRLQLLQSIDAGMDEGSALSSATSRMQVAAERAAADANGTALGNVFDTAGLMYEGSQAAKGRQAGQEWWNQYSGPGRRAGTNPTGVSNRLPGE